MKNKQSKHKIKQFIATETGIHISNYLSSMICDPHCLEQTNNSELEKLIKEFAPIYQRFRGTLDGPRELQDIMFFSIGLQCKIQNNSELLQLFIGDNIK